ncbi:5-methyltetrahydropteroyltriglutamate--homocysteine methyltransferase [Brachybacterium phenoliresistens]|uniref:5-methyltetrahydropteroyltriglutamate--homocysteine S-methyltransferase n=1 Tax=Brachybacterium phenoliresistens TaxID=396014 RepID=Z9JT90_9MICO|nr:5-methyltetrahydropteroyltriglutamate--homocysteine S-methyltransferase [Brachybacterium phenoliresistens]EWS81565.1 5-methyltetrahydropteroyltriglutamate--homocysteine methyltransferase [Brachybacterium phenoliresistens]
MTSTPALPAATILGYPRIGPNRELKKAEESYWAGRSDLAALEETGRTLRAATRARLAELGLAGEGAIPESFSWYDQVLDAAVTVGALPSRFADLQGEDGSISLASTFVLARGDEQRPPLEMTKWFDTNYHYLVPEIGPDTAFDLAGDQLVRWVREAAAAGDSVRPVIVGPLTLLLLAKAADDAPEGFDPITRLADLVPVYVELLAALRAAGAAWVQIDEPALSADQRLTPAELSELVAQSTAVLAAAADRPAILVTTGYGHPEGVLPALLASGVEALHLDLVKGQLPAVEDLAGAGATQLVAGVINGRNIWRAELGTAAARVAELASRLEQAGGTGGVVVGTSTSLQHVPHDVTLETKLPAELRETLAFADQKVTEVVELASGSVAAGSVDGPLSVARTFAGVQVPAVRERAAAVTAADTERAAFSVRAAAQQEALGLPELPTTTIGSFPQVGEVRKARAAHRKGQIDDAAYTQAMKDEIARVIALQEELGLDVLVHGEPERNDMVQYFAENLEGFATTEHGWVQSYGSRCTRPSILFGDVHRAAPITVDWATYAQSLTQRPVKGMLTGPVTILAWSFVRDDQPLGDTAAQVGLALRDEVNDLEAAGIGIVQVDEPALRELLPLRTRDHDAYLDWSVASFRLATSGVAEATQIHTHLCYSEFNVVVDAIDALNADVTSIESARSRGEIVEALDPEAFPRGIGPGVWDIHSPRVPSVEEIAEQLTRARAAVGAERLWVNPDCGLKTRGYAETEASLKNLVEATLQVRAAAQEPALV